MGPSYPSQLQIVFSILPLRYLHNGPDGAGTILLVAVEAFRRRLSATTADAKDDVVGSGQGTTVHAAFRLLM